VITVKEAADRLGVAQKTVYQWINTGLLSSHKLGNELYLEQADVDKLQSSIDTANQLLPDKDIDISLTDMLQLGGIFYHVGGTSKRDVLINALSLIEGLDSPEMNPILQMFLTREEVLSTGIGNGIAIPHASGTLVGYVNQPLISIAFLETPIDYGALDGKPVHVLFSIISPNVSMHLRILAKLARILHDPQCKEAVISEASEETIIKVFKEAEDRYRQQQVKG
jgi:nitrogen PTS system EIIA component